MWGLCVAVKARHFENVWLIPASPLESQHLPLKKSPWPGPTSPSPSSPWRTAPCSPTLSPRTSSTRCTTSAPSPTLTATSSTLWRTWTHSPVETIPQRTSSTLLPTLRISRLTSRQEHHVVGQERSLISNIGSTDWLTLHSQAPPASLLSLPPEELITCINRWEECRSGNIEIGEELGFPSKRNLDCCFYSYNACLPPAQHCVWDPELSLYNGYIRFCLS